MAKKNKIKRPAASTSMAGDEFNPDYSIIRKDLKQIGTLVGILFFILVASSFFLR